MFSTFFVVTFYQEDIGMNRLTNLGIRFAKAKSSVYTLSDERDLTLRVEPLSYNHCLVNDTLFLDF